MCSTNCKGTFLSTQKESSTSEKCRTSSTTTKNVSQPSHLVSKYKMSPFQEEMLEPKTRNPSFYLVQSKKKEVFGMNMTFNAQKDLRKKYQNLKEEYHA